MSSGMDGLCAVQHEFCTPFPLGRSFSVAHSKNVPCFSLALELLHEQSGTHSALDQVDVVPSACVNGVMLPCTCCLHVKQRVHRSGLN